MEKVKGKIYENWVVKKCYSNVLLGCYNVKDYFPGF